MSWYVTSYFRVPGEDDPTLLHNVTSGPFLSQAAAELFAMNVSNGSRAFRGLTISCDGPSISQRFSPHHN